MITLEAFSDTSLSIPFESDDVQVTIDNAQEPPLVLMNVAKNTIGFSTSIFFKGSTLSGKSNFIEFQIAKCGQEQFSQTEISPHFEFDMYSYWGSFGHSMIQFEQL